MTATITPPRVSSARALEIAETDAVRVYRDLSIYQIRLRLESDGWYVEYGLKDPTLNGGGPHYRIDASTGEILVKRYYQ